MAISLRIHNGTDKIEMKQIDASYFKENFEIIQRKEESQSCVSCCRKFNTVEEFLKAFRDGKSGK
jgi:hypothetical protein